MAVIVRQDQLDALQRQIDRAEHDDHGHQARFGDAGRVVGRQAEHGTTVD